MARGKKQRSWSVAQFQHLLLPFARKLRLLEPEDKSLLCVSVKRDIDLSLHLKTHVYSHFGISEIRIHLIISVGQLSLAKVITACTQP